MGPNNLCHVKRHFLFFPMSACNILLDLDITFWRRKIVVWAPNFRLFRSTNCCFQDIAHFRIFSLTAMLKVQSATIFFEFLEDHQNIYIFRFPYNCFIYHTFWLWLDQNCGRSGPVLTKILKCHNFFLNFWNIAKTFVTFYSPMNTLFIVKFGSDRMKIVRSFFIFAPLLMKTKKNRKHLKIGKFEKIKKMVLEIWWKGSCP